VIAANLRQGILKRMTADIKEQMQKELGAERAAGRGRNSLSARWGCYPDCQCDVTCTAGCATTLPTAD
jgi:hypothetical protein